MAWHWTKARYKNQSATPYLLRVIPPERKSRWRTLDEVLGTHRAPRCKQAFVKFLKRAGAAAPARPSSVAFTLIVLGLCAFTQCSQFAHSEPQSTSTMEARMKYE
jgi:hypothetical protein